MSESVTIARHDDGHGIVTEIRVIHGQAIVIVDEGEPVPRRKHATTLAELFRFVHEMPLTDEELAQAVGCVVGKIPVKRD